MKLAIGYGNLLGTFLTTNLFGKEIAQNLLQLRQAGTTKMELYYAEVFKNQILVTGCSLGSRHFQRLISTLFLKESVTTLLILLYTLPFDFSRTKLMLITLEWVSNALLFVLHA